MCEVKRLERLHVQYPFLTFDNTIDIFELLPRSKISLANNENIYLRRI